MKRTKGPSRLGEAVGKNARAQIIKMPKDQRSEQLDQKLSNEEMFFERDFVTGIIVDDDFCRWARKNVPAKTLQATAARKLAYWVYEYFDKYARAPKKDIGPALYSREAVLHPVELEDFEDILLSLSEEYESRQAEINFSYLRDRSARYRDTQVMRAKIQEAEALIANNELADAVEVLRYEPQTGRSLAEQLKSTLCPSTEYIARQIPRLRRLLKPWLAEGSLTLIYGPRGVGKTWLCLLVAIALTREEQEDLAVGPWQAKHRAGVLYVDGEMNNWELQDNLRELAAPLTPEDVGNPLLVLSAHDFAQAHEKQINIASQEWRDALYQTVRNDQRVKVLILDNVAALSPGLDENVKRDWDPVNQWLISLRHLGVATILIHHAGKGGLQRGTSGREDAMDTIIKLSEPVGYTERDYAWFKVSFDKSRNLRPGDSKGSFTIRIVEHPDGGLTWREEEEEGQAGGKSKKVMAELVKGRSNKEVAKMSELSHGRVSQIKKEAKRLGYLDKQGKPTPEGIAFAQEHGGDGVEPVGE